MSKEEIAWDLSGMYAGPADPKIDEMVKDLSDRSKEMDNKYRGKIVAPGFTSDSLLELLHIEEIIKEDLEELAHFAGLTFSANMIKPENQKLQSKIEEFSTTLSKDLAFLDIDLGKFLLANPNIITDPVLSNYKHYLERVKRAAKHRLEENEEQIILEKDQYGINAWSQLQGMWLNTRQFEVDVEGEKQVLPYGEANGLLHHPDRATRTSVNKSIYGLLGKDEAIFSAALRNVCNDWMKTSNRRKFSSPMGQSTVDNDCELTTVDTLMKVIDESRPVYRRYLTLKAKLLELPKLGCEDVVAPIPNLPHKNYEWPEAKEIVLGAYQKFDSEFHHITSDMFEKNHIDASPRNGKLNGAFCETWFKGKGAFMLQSFTGSMSDIYTLAHELGHAIHAYLITANQTIYNAEIPMIIAEIASTFGELLVTDSLLSKAESKEEKIAILQNVLDNAGMAVFQVSARVWFEQDLYKAIDNGEYLDGETISKYWCKGRDKIYGDAVEWFPEMNWEWAMKPHYFIPNFRFYNYPYVFAQLFVYALYQKYLEEGAEFIPKFKQILAAGSSMSPKEIGDIMGFDINQPAIWEAGVKQFERFVNLMEELI